LYTNCLSMEKYTGGETLGPVDVGHLYRFAVTLHEVLADPANTDRGVVFWSEADSRSENGRLNSKNVQTLTESDRSRKCSMHARMLHGTNTELAASSCASTNCADGSSMHAIQRCRIQPGRLCSHNPGCCVWSMAGQGGGSLQLKGVQSRRVSCTKIVQVEYV